MKEEFNLSEKIGYVHDYQIMQDKENTHPSVSQGVFEFEDVKEFIKRLKDKMDNSFDDNFMQEKHFIKEEIINKLAGEKLCI